MKRLSFLLLAVSLVAFAAGTVVAQTTEDEMVRRFIEQKEQAQKEKNKKKKKAAPQKEATAKQVETAPAVDTSKNKGTGQTAGTTTQNQPTA